MFGPDPVFGPVFGPDPVFGPVFGPDPVFGPHGFRPLRKYPDTKTGTLTHV